MKGRIAIAILVLALLMSSVFAGATTVTKNDDNSISPLLVSGYHKRTLTPPWNHYGYDKIPMQGDVELTATSNSLSGYAQSKCEFDTVLQQHTEEGKAVFDHSFEWTSPVDSDSAYVQFEHYLSWEIKMYSSWGTQGDEARVRIGILFFVDSNSVYKDIIDWTRVGGIDDEYSYAETYSQGITISLQKGKTYNIGVQVFAYSWATAFSGYVLSRATVSHEKEDSCVIIKWQDRPPATPSKPSGPESVNLKGHLSDGVTCTYYTAPVTDPDNENVEYQWYFGDKTYYTEWSQSTSVQYTWTSKVLGDFEVKVKARGTDTLVDGFPAESSWSEPLKVHVYFKFSREVSSPLVLRILERFPGLSTLFERLLQNL